MTKVDWEEKLSKCQEAFWKNNFEAYVVQSTKEAEEVVLRDIIPRVHPASISWGDSETLFATGLIKEMKKLPGVEVVETFDEKGCEAANWESVCRKALTVELFLAGSNAITETGQLVNLDMVGNRVGGISFGPKFVVILVGRNKISNNLDAAVDRVRNYAATTNAARHNLNTPCVKTGKCADCSSPDRICNVWGIIEKSYPKGRIKMILINEDLGL